MEAGKSHFLTNEIFKNIEGRQPHTAYESVPLLWLLRPQHGTFFKLLTNTKDSHLCRHCQIYKQFFLWKHSVISGFVYGSPSIWRRLKSLMRAEGPAAFSLCGTWRPVQCQLQPDCFNVASPLLTKAHPLHLLASFCSSLELKLCKGQGMSRLASEPRSSRSLCAHLELNRLPAWPQTP